MGPSRLGSSHDHDATNAAEAPDAPSFHGRFHTESLLKGSELEERRIYECTEAGKSLRGRHYPNGNPIPRFDVVSIGPLVLPKPKPLGLGPKTPEVMESCLSDNRGGYFASFDGTCDGQDLDGEDCLANPMTDTKSCEVASVSSCSSGGGDIFGASLNSSNSLKQSSPKQRTKLSKENILSSIPMPLHIRQTSTFAPITPWIDAASSTVQVTPQTVIYDDWPSFNRAASAWRLPAYVDRPQYSWNSERLQTWAEVASLDERAVMPHAIAAKSGDVYTKCHPFPAKESGILLEAPVEMSSASGGNGLVLFCKDQSAGAGRLPLEIIQNCYEFSANNDTFGRDFELSRRSSPHWYYTSLHRPYLLEAIRSMGYSTAYDTIQDVHELSSALTQEAIFSGLYMVDGLFETEGVNLFNPEHVWTEPCRCVLSTSGDIMAQYLSNQVALFSLAPWLDDSLRGPLVLPLLQSSIRQIHIDDMADVTMVAALDVEGNVSYLCLHGHDPQWITVDKTRFTNTFWTEQPLSICISVREQKIYLGYKGQVEVFKLDWFGSQRRRSKAQAKLHTTGVCDYIRLIQHPQHDGEKIVPSPALESRAARKGNDWEFQGGPAFFNAVPFRDGELVVYSTRDRKLLVGSCAPPAMNKPRELYGHFELLKPWSFDPQNDWPELYAVGEHAQFGARIAALFGSTLVLYSLPPDTLAQIKPYMPVGSETRPEIYGVNVGYDGNTGASKATTPPLGLRINPVIIDHNIYNVSALKVFHEYARIVIFVFTTDGAVLKYYYNGVSYL